MGGFSSDPGVGWGTYFLIGFPTILAERKLESVAEFPVL
jgi:hypothetical protein